MTGQRILVTGVTGLIGFPLAVELAKSNTVYGASRFRKKNKAGIEQHGIIPVEVDFTSADLGALPDGVDYVFNQAMAYTDDFAHSMAINAFAAGRLMERYKHSKGIVLASTGSVYPRTDDVADEDTPLCGTHPYAVSKICGDMFGVYFSIRDGTPTCILRYYTPYSPTGGRRRWHVDNMADGQPLLCPKARCAPLFITDVVAMTIRAGACCTSPPTIINVAGDERITKKDLADRLAEAVGRPAVFGGPHADDTRSLVCDNTKRKRLLGEQTVSLDEGIRRVCDAYRQGQPTDPRPSA